MEERTHFLIRLALVLVMCVAGIALIHAAHADENITAVVNASAVLQKDIPERIMQGQCVEIGKTYDISGLGWNSGKIGWYGRYNTELAPSNESLQNMIDIPYTVKELSNYYIDPRIFYNYQGYWYVMYDSRLIDKAANNRLFKVSEKCIAPNKTVEPVVKPPVIGLQQFALEQKRVSDLVLARGDYLTINATLTNSTLWIFGYSDGYYGYPMKANNTYIPEWMFENFDVGTYKIVVQTAGNNTQMDIIYDAKNEQIVPLNRYLDIVDLKESALTENPPLVREKLMQLSRQTDDIFKEYDLSFHEPYADIDTIDQQTLMNKTYLEVSGYSNLQGGTQIRLAIDLNNYTMKSSRYKDSYTTVNPMGKGYLGTYHAYIPIDYDEIPAGQHTLSLILPNKKVVTAPIYVREELPANYNPPKYLKFVDHSPYIPIPTPEIIIKKEIQIQENFTTIVKEVEPNYDIVTKKIIDEATPYVVALLVLALPAMYLISVAIRTFFKRRGE